jgi:ABC-type bacteriocin/lantibiotic exporter with double-glycine peptidase domain
LTSGTVRATSTSLTGALRPAFDLLKRLKPGDRRLFWLSILSSALERIGIVAVAWAIARADRLVALGVLGAISGLFALTRALRTALGRHVRVACIDTVVARMLEADVLAPPGESNADVVGVFDGLNVADRLVGEQMPALISDLAASVVLLPAALLFLPPRVVMVGMLAIALTGAAAGVARAVTARLAERTYCAYEPIQDELLALIEGRLDIVASGYDDDFRARLDHAAREWRRVARRSDWITGLGGRVPAIVGASVIAAAIALDRFSGGDFSAAAIASAAVVLSGTPAFFGVLRNTFEIARTDVRLRAMFKIIESPPRFSGPAISLSVPELPASIEFHGVSFAYAGRASGPRTNALSDVSLAWPTGKILALEGPNGAGKSTMLRLLLGLAMPDTGRITIGGVDLRTLDLRAWRKRVAYLPQQPYASERRAVRDAMRLVTPDVDDERIRRALERLEVWSVLANRMPADPLSVGVATLSAGQRQRVAIARVLCREAPVIILDEPDRNLDRAGSALLSALLRELARTSMVAVAAHVPELLDLGDVRLRLGGSSGWATSSRAKAAAS